MHRLSVAAIISSYKNNEHHTINTKAKPGFCISYKSELFLKKRRSLLVGLEYFNHGLSFNGYFSASGHTYLFDETFPYKHEIRIQELHLPIGVKIAFKSEKDNFYTPYCLFGIGARYIIGSYALISNDSTEAAVYDNKTNVDFEYQFIKGFNTFINGGLGIQSNFRKSGGAAFFEINYKYGFSRLHYTGYQNSNNLNIKDAHLSLTVGIRF